MIGSSAKLLLVLPNLQREKHCESQARSNSFPWPETANDAGFHSSCHFRSSLHSRLHPRKLGTRTPEQEQIYLDSLWAKFEEILAAPGKCRVRNDLFSGCQIAAQGRARHSFPCSGNHSANCP